MDPLTLLRTLGGLGIVLGLLATALWLVRRYDIKLPGRVAGSSRRRLELVERLPIDARRSVALIRRDGREHMILLAPEGALVVEASIVRDEVDDAAEQARAIAEQERAAGAQAEAAALRESFATMVERAGEGVRGLRQAVHVRRHDREDTLDA